MRTPAFLLAAALVSGCYRSHEREPARDAAVIDAHSPDAGLDAGDAGPPEPDADAGPPEPDAGPGPCTTECEVPQLIASVSFSDSLLEPWAVLDVAPLDGSLVALVSAGDLTLTGVGTRIDYRLLHVPLVSGAPRFEAHADLWTNQAFMAGSVRRLGAGYRVVALRADPDYVTEPQDVVVVIATWARAGAEPDVAFVPLREEPIPGCTRCYRHGGAVVQDAEHAVAAVAGDGELYVARIAFADRSVERWTIAIPDASPDAPAWGASDGFGRALLTAGGAISEYRGSYEGAAFALQLSDRSPRDVIEVPGDRYDPPPRAVFFPDRAELVRFAFGADATTGVIRRWIADTSELMEQPPIETGAGLPPLAITSSGGTLVWAEVDLALPGAAILRALGHAPQCTSEAPITAAHLPSPLADLDPRVIAAAEHDGRTYVLVLEHLAHQYRAAVLDLGRCLATRR